MGKFTHITLFVVSKDSLKNINDGLNLVDNCDDPNAMHRWNSFKREVIRKPNYYKNYFSLTKEK